MVWIEKEKLKALMALEIGRANGMINVCLLQLLSSFWGWWSNADLRSSLHIDHARVEREHEYTGHRWRFHGKYLIVTYSSNLEPLPPRVQKP